jgi:hypothetical protein
VLDLAVGTLELVAAGRRDDGEPGEPHLGEAVGQFLFAPGGGLRATVIRGGRHETVTPPLHLSSQFHGLRRLDLAHRLSENGTGSIVTATVRTVALCISSGARKLGPTSERGHEEIQ